MINNFGVWCAFFFSLSLFSVLSGGLMSLCTNHNHTLLRDNGPYCLIAWQMWREKERSNLKDEKTSRRARKNKNKLAKNKNSCLKRKPAEKGLMRKKKSSIAERHRLRRCRKKKWWTHLGLGLQITNSLIVRRHELLVGKCLKRRSKHRETDIESERKRETLERCFCFTRMNISEFRVDSKERKKQTTSKFEIKRRKWWQI